MPALTTSRVNKSLRTTPALAAGISDHVSSVYELLTDRQLLNNLVALEKFLNDIDGLHDTLLHEAVLLHPGYVNHKGEMFEDSFLPDARLIFQSQFADVAAVQLDLKNVSRFRLELTRDFRLEGEFDGGEVVLYLCGKQSADLSVIRAAQAEYRMLGRDFLGPTYRLINPWSDESGTQI